MQEFEFIIYVSDQEKSTWFYQNLLQIEPCLNVPGMTEFALSDSVKLGLMPEDRIAKILSDKMPHPKLGHGIPRCELYLRVENAEEYLKRGIDLGAIEVSELQLRDWGENVGYISDLDGHVIAFAENSK
jgi:hypothetical protein